MYLLIDSMTTYFPECPDPVVIETVLERSYTLTTTGLNLAVSNPYVHCFGHFLGWHREVEIRFYPYDGTFKLKCLDDEVGNLTTFSPVDYMTELYDNGGTDDNIGLPFPTGWELSNNGIEVDWNPQSWVENSQSFRLIPFWHEAE